MEITKVDENTIKVIKIEEVQTDTNFTYEELLNQKANIISQKESFCDQRDIEIAEVEELISECEKLGVKLKEEKLI